jgi:IS30 family transposase
VNSSVVEQIEEWINHYPRRIHGFKTAEEMSSRSCRHETHRPEKMRHLNFQSTIHY